MGGGGNREDWVLVTQRRKANAAERRFTEHPLPPLHPKEPDERVLWAERGL